MQQMEEQQKQQRCLRCIARADCSLIVFFHKMTCAAVLLTVMFLSTTHATSVARLEHHHIVDSNESTSSSTFPTRVLGVTAAELEIDITVESRPGAAAAPVIYSSSLLYDLQRRIPEQASFDMNITFLVHELQQYHMIPGTSSPLATLGELHVQIRELPPPSSIDEAGAGHILSCKDQCSTGLILRGCSASTEVDQKSILIRTSDHVHQLVLNTGLDSRTTASSPRRRKLISTSTTSRRRSRQLAAGRSSSHDQQQSTSSQGFATRFGSTNRLIPTGPDPLHN
ncbi:unnamed protein product [Sphagnum troendelagicum]|uniref:Membrane-associated protein n=1 Tax=Sphagnum troendelagicum TaxID=128251 RepID=A0ABP0TF72_9BRYO